MRASLLLGSIALFACSGVVGLGGRSARRAALAAAMVVTGALAAMAAVVPTLLGAGNLRIRLPWSVPGGELDLLVDPLAAFFLVPVLVVSPLGAIYGLEYWSDEHHPSSGMVRLFYGIAGAGLVVVMIAHNAVLFLAAWEVVGLSAFFLVGAEGRAESRAAAFVYLTATHAATLALFVVFGILRSCTGSYALDRLPAGVAAGPLGGMLFLLALFGFGMKAGLMPFHLWLPGAHAAAPTHVSALMSGVIIKMGVYGLVRVLFLFPDPPRGWGLALLLLGMVSGILGVAFALGQHDLKRLLAYHSIENIGIIVMGFGLALLGRSAGRTDLMVLGLAAGALHVWNHAFFKALLFYGAGAVVHMTTTRELERLGGLSKRAPMTAGLFLLGAAAICGLPPLNGFVSELFLYGGLLRMVTGAERTAGPPGAWPESHLALLGALGAFTLASIGALALACFVKAFGVVFLGEARDDAAQPRGLRSTASVDVAGDVSWQMRLPGLVLASLCVGIGLFPGATTAPLGHVLASLAADVPTLAQLVAFAPWTRANLLLVLGLGLGLATGAVALRRGRQPRRTASTWDCGYARPSARMQYTGSSLAAGLVHAFRWALMPAAHVPAPLPIFPREARFESHVPEVVLDRVVTPVVRGLAWLFAFSTYLQRGHVQVYLLYVLVTLVVFLSWL